MTVRVVLDARVLDDAGAPLRVGIHLEMMAMQDEPNVDTSVLEAVHGQLMQRLFAALSSGEPASTSQAAAARTSASR